MALKHQGIFVIYSQVAGEAGLDKFRFAGKNIERTGKLQMIKAIKDK